MATTYETPEDSFYDAQDTMSNASFNQAKPPDPHNEYITNAKRILKGSQQLNAKIKPINLSSLLSKFFSAPTMKLAVKTFIKILELYEVYWEFSFSGAYTVIKMLVTGLRHLPMLVKEAGSFLSTLRTPTLPQSQFTDLISGYAKTLGASISPESGNALALVLSLAVPIVAIVGCIAGSFTTIGAKISKAIALAGNACKGSDTLLSSFSSVRNTVKDVVYSTFGLGSPSAKTEAQLQKEQEEASKTAFILEIDTSLAEIVQFHDMIREDPASFLRTPNATQILTATLDKANSIMQRSSHEKFLAAQCRYQLDALRSNIGAIKKIYTDLLSSVKGKQIPVTLWLYGASGVGKSRAANALIDYIAYFEQRPLTTYSRNPSLAHWDGYSGQDVVIYDDFGQDVQNTDHLELQQIYTPNEWIVPQAGVEQKGRRFTSKYLVICSNFPMITSSKRMTDVSVNHRRRDLFFRVNDVVVELHDADNKSWRDYTAQEKKAHYKPDFSHLTFTALQPIPDPDTGTIVDAGLPCSNIYNIAKDMYTLCVERSDEHDKLVRASVTNFLQGATRIDNAYFDGLNAHHINSKPLKFHIKPLTVQVYRDEFDVLVDDLFIDAGLPIPPPGVIAVDVPITRIDPKDNPVERRKVNLTNIRGQRVLKGMHPLSPLERRVHPAYCIVCFDDTVVHNRCAHCNFSICTACEEITNPIGNRIGVPSACCCLADVVAQVDDIVDRPPPPPQAPDQEVPEHVRKFLEQCVQADVQQAVGQALTTQRITRQPIVLLAGSPGTGKSTVARYATAFEVHDEFTRDDAAFLAGVARVFHCYDQPDEPLLLTCNIATLEAMFAKHYPGDPDKRSAFLRRCDFYEFTFKRSWTMLRYNVSHLRNHAHHEVVNISRFVDGVYSRSVEISFVRAILADPKPFTEKVDFITSLPLCPFPVERDIHVRISVSPAQLKEEKRRFRFADFQFVKGYSFIPKFMRFFAILGRREFCSIEEAIFAIQEQNIVSDCDLIGVLESPEGNFVLKGTTGSVCELFRVADEDIPEEITEDMDAVSEQLVIVSQSLDKLFLFLDCLVHLGLHGLGAWVIADDHMENRRDRVARHLTSFVFPESWSSDVEEADEDDFVQHDHQAEYAAFCAASAKRLPKSARQPRQVSTEYCPSHHKVACPCLVKGQRQKRRFNDPYQQSTKPSLLENRVVAESGSFAEIESRRKLPPKLTIIAEEPPAPVVEKADGESINDPQALNISMLCCNNTVEILGESGTVLCRGLMVGNRIGVTVAHIANERFSVRTATGATFLGSIHHVEVGRDLLFFELPNTAQQFKDITKHFQKRDSIKDLSGYKALLNVVSRTPTTTINSQRPMLLKKNSRYELDGVEKYGYAYSGHLDSYDCTSVTTNFGDCGSALVILNPQMTTKILGIHSAANMTSSYAAPLYQEDFSIVQAQSANNIKFLRSNWVTPVDTDDTYCGFPIVGLAEHEGKRIKQNCPTSTELWTSPFKEAVPHEFEPCLLSQYDPRNPGHDFLHTGPTKWNHPQPEVDLALLEHCTEEWANYYAYKIFGANLKNAVLTKTEAINGVSYLPGSNPIYRQSSAGYPFKHLPGVKQKTTFFKQRDGLFVIDNNSQGTFLNEAIDRLIDTSKTTRPGNVFTVSLKDEPRKLKKIYGDSPATRTFAACSLDYTLAQRMYFHTAAASITSIFAQLPCKIGIDSKSLDWESLYYWHARVSTVGFDMDFKDWDATVPLVFMQQLPVIYNRIYQVNDADWKLEDDIIRNNIHSVVHGPLLLIDDVVVQAPGGQVSGQPLTALDNCFVNCLYSYYIWCKLAPRKLANFSSYIEKVAISVYGDDNITTVAPDCLSFFNFTSYAAECVKLGLSVTDANKTGEVVDFQPLESLSFLKQGFTRASGHIIGLPEKSSIHKMLSYCHNPRNHKWANERDVVRFRSDSIDGVVKDALIFAAPHGKEYFEELKLKLLKCSRDFSVNVPEWPTYNSVIRDVYLGTVPASF
jgi:hypothetical protein